MAIGLTLGLAIKEIKSAHTILEVFKNEHKIQILHIIYF